jgi:hypothetical protein
MKKWGAIAVAALVSVFAEDATNTLAAKLSAINPGASFVETERALGMSLLHQFTTNTGNGSLACFKFGRTNGPSLYLLFENAKFMGLKRPPVPQFEYKTYRGQRWQVPISLVGAERVDLVMKAPLLSSKEWMNYVLNWKDPNSIPEPKGNLSPIAAAFAPLTKQGALAAVKAEQLRKKCDPKKIEPGMSVTTVDSILGSTKATRPIEDYARVKLYGPELPMMSPAVTVPLWVEVTFVSNKVVSVFSGDFVRPDGQITVDPKPAVGVVQ